MHDPTLSDKPLPPQETKKFTCSEQAGSVHLHPEGKLNSQKPKLCGVWEKKEVCKNDTKKEKKSHKTIQMYNSQKTRTQLSPSPMPTHPLLLDKDSLVASRRATRKVVETVCPREGSRSPEFGGLACLHPLRPAVPGGQ